ncbi:MAG: KpsF/GutQ family sugar-phosphate isomerase [Pseudomonadota bacterium]
MSDFLASAHRTLELEAAGLRDLSASLADGALRQPFVTAVELIQEAAGRVVVTGIGKSGHVGTKIAATLASTGTPAQFVHPSEASHGDLGMVTYQDVILALSWSGETFELGSIINYAARFTVPMIAITSRRDSALGSAADVTLALPRAAEACPHGLAPTTSTTMQLALGDCLAIALLEARGFTAEDFKVYHPGGQLGAQLKFVRDVMHTREHLPLVHEGVPMADALVTMTEKSFGCLGVVDADGCLVGVLTDGDLRRNMGPRLIEQSVGDVMSRRPKTAPPDLLASAALEQINSSGITALFVVEGQRPIGLVHIHDLLRLGVV